RLPSSTLFPYTTLFRSLSSQPEQPAFSCARLLSAGCAVEGPWLDCSLATSFDLELSCRTLVYRELQAVSQGRGLEPLTRQLPASDRKSTRLNSSHGSIS